MFMSTVSLTAAASAGGSAEAYLFTYFTGNGESGLHLAWSEDGSTWRSVAGGRSLLKSTLGRKEQLMRDPAVVRGPDGVYHLVWTTGWNEAGIGYANTRDFVTFSEPREIPVMAHKPAVRNCWAPEIVYDEATGEFVIFWASTIPGAFPETAGSSEDAYNHRMYATTTRDFEVFTPTRLFYEPGFSVIDAAFLRAADGSLHWIVKDETVNPPRKHLRLAAAESVQGPFGELGAPFTPQGLWVEGPSGRELPGGAWLVYFDAYTARRYGAMRSRVRGATWENLSAEIMFPNEGMPQRVRHWSALGVPRALWEMLTQLKAEPVARPRAESRQVAVGLEAEAQAETHRHVAEGAFVVERV